MKSAGAKTWYIDVEWGYRPGRKGSESAYVPVVFCAVEATAGERHFFGGQDHGLSAFFEEHRDDLFVSHVVVAEMKYLLRMGIPLPKRWFDTYLAFRLFANMPGRIEGSLIFALNFFKLPYEFASQKEAIRDDILHLRYSAADHEKIVRYCFSDCDGCGLLYQRLVAEIDPRVMRNWCIYLAAISRMELRGIPVDINLVRLIFNSSVWITDFLMDQVNAVYSLYRERSFSRSRFFEWATSVGISWPRKRNDKGKPVKSLDSKTLKMMRWRHPFIRLVRDVRKTVGSFNSRKLNFDGRHQRHYFSTWSFRSITGRNQPKDFIYCGPKWLRYLIVPESKDHALIYVDYIAEEIGIAAHLSGDPNLRAIYGENHDADDPHLAFAKLAKAIPADAIREKKYEPIRDIYKTINIGALYLMTKFGISDRLGISQLDALDLLAQHKELFEQYWKWSQLEVERAYSRGRVRTRFGWTCQVPRDSKFRTWANWPIQAAGGDIMRLTIVYLDQLGLRVLAPVHDGFLISCLKSDVAETRAKIDQACQAAVTQVLDDFPLRWDIKEYHGRITDKGGEKVWKLIQEALKRMR